MKLILLHIISLGLYNPHYVILKWDYTPKQGVAQVYRGTTPGGPYSHLACQSAKGTCSDRKVVKGTTYYYVAKFAKPASGFSKETVATAK